MRKLNTKFDNHATLPHLARTGQRVGNAAILFFGAPSVSRLRQIARDTLGLSRKTTLSIHVLTVEGEIDVWATVGRGEAREFYVWTLTGNKLSGPVKSSATTYRRRRAAHAGLAS